MKPIIFILTTLFFFISCEKKENIEPHILKNLSNDFYLNKEANILTETVVRETFQKWAEKTHFTFVYKGRNKAGLHEDGKNTVSFLLKWPIGIPIDKVAYCKNWYNSSGKIIESDIIFNMQLTNFTTLRTNKPGSYYIEGVLAHEIGHLIGLGHIDDPSSIMKKKSDYKESYHKGNIDKKTIAAYRLLYKIDVK